VSLRRWICRLLSLLRIHSPNCKHCMARRAYGDQLRKRLEELGDRTPPSSVQNNEDHRSLQRAG
jgi:hypothetical protein